MAAESKLQRFERIAERRANETIRALRLLGNLSDRRNYEYTDVHVDRLLSAVEQEVRSLKSRFRSESGSGAKPFRFK
jgi:hypothetical protein